MKRKRSIFFWIIPGLIVLVIAVGWIRNRKNVGVAVETTMVERKDEIVSVVSASGEIAAKNFVDIQAEIAGVITELFVKEGDIVKSGDVLLRIDATQNQADYQSTQAQLDGALFDVQLQNVQFMLAEAGLRRDEASLHLAKLERDQTESAYKRAKRSFERRKELFDQGLLSAEEFDAANLELEQREAQFLAAQARMTQAETQVEVSKLNIDQVTMLKKSSESRASAAQANVIRSKDLLSKTTIYAPLDGMIIQLNVEVGERAVPGTINSPQATLMRIADTSVFQAEIQVGETDIIRIKPGNPAKITLDALPYEPLSGTVTEIGSSPIGLSTGLSGNSNSSAVKEFKVLITLDHPPVSLKPGLSASAEITTEVRKDVLSIPIQAVTIRDVFVDEHGIYIPEKELTPEEQKTKIKKEMQGIFLFTPDHSARFQIVKTGIVGQTLMEVTEGLHEGDEVISGSYKVLRTLQDGDTVRKANFNFSAATN